MSEASTLRRVRQLRGQGDDSDVVTLSTGVRVRLHPVSSALVEDLKATIPDPAVPVQYIEAKDRDEENPNDPAYLKALDEAQEKRGQTVLLALTEFGVELLDGLPEDGKWLRQVKRLARMGGLDLSAYNLDDPDDLELLYKRYVAVAGADLGIIGQLHGLRPLEVARARAMFLGHTERDAAGRVPAEGSDSDGHPDERPAVRVGSGEGGEPGPGEVG